MNYMTRLLFNNFRVPIKKGYFHRNKEKHGRRKALTPIEKAKIDILKANRKNVSQIAREIRRFGLKIEHNYKMFGKRNLLTATALGLDRFLEAKKLVNENMKDKEKFLNEMKEVSNCENDTLIFTNDIKKIVMLVSEENLELIPKLLRKLSSQNETLKFQRYVFGPDIMKLYHLHNKPMEALALVEDKNTVQHFIQITSFSVLADLLFNNGMYQDVICIYQYFHSKANVHRNAVQAMIILYFGACYKLNSRDSLDDAISLWKKLVRRGIRVHKRALGFLGSLALNQNKPQIAIETMHHSRPDSILLSIKVMGLAKSKRYDDVFETLKDAFKMDNSLFITSDAISCVRDQLTNDKIDYIPKFHQTVDELKANNYISHKSLDDVLNEEVDVYITYKGAKENRR